MDNPKRVVIGILGALLDSSQDVDRWTTWRPSVSLCQHEELLIDRFELLYEPKFVRSLDQVCEDIASISPETTVVPRELKFSDPWDFEEVYAALHGFASAYPFNTDDEEYLVHISTGTHVAQICLFLLTESRHLPGKLLQTSPPARRNSPEPGSFQIIDLDLSRYDRLASRFAREQQESVSFLKSGIETRNAEFNRLIDRIERVAMHSRAPLLVMGPTGAGKSRLARRIFELKQQRRQVAGKFVEVNCATLRGDSAMSALFGHVKGAFTGAAADRPGLLRSADQGVLFLDEIGELGLDEQALLLRALEEKLFLPVGSDKEVSSDFQLIAGTNRDLAERVSCGQFREDLLARINLWTFRLPSLRERPEDLEPNIQFELDQFAAENGSKINFSKESFERFLTFATGPEALWSGNFRDLNAAVTRMGTLAGGGRITVENVDEEIARLRTNWVVPGGRGVGSSTDLAEWLTEDAIAQIDPFDRTQLAEVIRVCRQSRNMSDAGRKLFAVSRLAKAMPNDADRLRKYLARFQLDWQKITEE